jgi:hypothetical protein
LIGEVPLQMIKIWAIFQPNGLRRATLALLAGRLDHVAIASPGHQAILHLAGCRQIPGKPPADAEDHDRDDQSCERAAAVAA